MPPIDWASSSFATLATAPGAVGYPTSNLPDGPHGFVEVRDEGAALAAEMQSRVFDPFFTTELAGRGLGLAAVLGIVRQHRGAVKVESAADEGTVFTLLLACAKTAARRKGGGAAPLSAERAG